MSDLKDKLTEEEYGQLYAQAFREGWDAAIKTLQNLEPPPVDLTVTTLPPPASGQDVK